MLRSIQCGIPLSEWEVLTIGMIYDYIINYDNLYGEEEEIGVRQATQADYDRW